MRDECEITREQIEAWLSPARYSSYLSVADGKDDVALALYLWNTGLVQAVLRDVSFFEVALRNAYNSCLEKGFDGDEHWLFDEESPIRRPILRTNKRKQLVDSNRINRNTIDHLLDGPGSEATPDDVIANLTLGFWTHMTDTNHERDLWIPTIHKAWNPGTSRKSLHRTLSEINKVRNRAAHHEHLFAPLGAECATRKACDDAMLLFGQLQPEVFEYVYGDMPKSSVDSYIEEHPAPCALTI